MRTIYCTQATPDASDRARREWGDDARVGYPGETGTAPYDPAIYEVVGYVAAHRSGPVMPVVRPRA